MTKKVPGLFIFLLLIFAYSSAFSQHRNVKIGGSLGERDPQEPSIIISPTNTSHIMAGANLNHYYFSNDSGESWIHGELISESYGVHGDPCLVADTEGNFYFFHLANPPGPGFADRIVCQKLDKDSTGWSEGTFTGLNGKMHDKEWAVVDLRNNNIFVTWTQFDEYGSLDPEHKSNIMFSRSTDQGSTWSEAVRINELSGNCEDDDNTVEGAVPAAGPNSEIYVSWAVGSSIYFDRSVDGGDTWLEEDKTIADIPGGWVVSIPGIYRCNGMPVTVCDAGSSPYAGNIYVNWSDQRNGKEDTDIWFVKSSDRGDNWSEVKRINNDPPGRHQFFTWMAVDQTNGFIYIVFYDRRNYDDLRTEVYLAVSKNGGDTFTNYKISESSFNPDRAVFLGDYNNISAHNNIIRPIWTRMDDRKLSLWTAIIDPALLMGIDETQSAVPTGFGISSVYPNPFNATSIIKYSLSRSGNAELNIFNILGRKVKTFFNLFHSEGNYQVEWNPENIASGVYVVSLKFNNTVKAEKIVYMK